MVLRREYLKQLEAFQDKDVIKVVTGIRRCRKSVLLQQFQEKLKSAGVSDDQIISINLEALENERLLDYHFLFENCKNKLNRKPGKAPQKTAHL